ncbi:histidine phosphatase family protein [Rhizobium sp. LjRoot254]|uniref:histidine phosphatase family protein n=1 Tax=Rhizobium sp. LjRoot254 TaxID=3342297 RepID=UPI003ECFA539
MTTRLTLICHGRTTARPSAFPADEPLAPDEILKIKELVPLLGKPDRVLSSPAHAAWQTAELISENFLVDRALADINYGRWSGARISDVQASEPESLAEWMDNPDFVPHGGESHADLLARIGAWLEPRLGERGHTVAVTHPNVARAAIIAVLGAPPQAFRSIDVEHLSIADLRSDGRRWALRSLGRLGLP